MTERPSEGVPKQADLTRTAALDAFFTRYSAACNPREWPSDRLTYAALAAIDVVMHPRCAQCGVTLTVVYYIEPEFRVCRNCYADVVAQPQEG